MSVKLKELIRRIILEDGGEILERDDDFIWARLDGKLTIYFIADEEVTGDTVINFQRVTEQVKAEKVILCVKGFDDFAKKTASNLNILLVPRDRIVKLIGEYVLEVLERDEDFSLLEEEDVTVEDIEYEIDEDEEEEEMEQDVIPIIIEDREGGEEKIIKVNISEKEAFKIATRYLRGFNAELNLVPYFIFEYSLKLVVEGAPENRAVSGIIAINALNGRYEIWKTGYETVSSIDYSHMKLEPKRPLEEAKVSARKHLMDEYTKEEEFTINDDNVTIIEKRKTRPMESTMKVNFLGLYYLPVWVITGRDGRIYINGATGEVSREDVYGITI